MAAVVIFAIYKSLTQSAAQKLNESASLAANEMQNVINQSLGNMSA